MNHPKTSVEKKTVSESNTPREFLLGRMEKQDPIGCAPGKRSDLTAGYLSDAPQKSEDRAFLDRVRERTEAVKRFSLLVVKQDPLGQAEAPREPEGTVLDDGNFSRIVEDVCGREKGIWGGIDGDLLGCCLLDYDIEASLALSKEIQQKAMQLNNGTVSIGAAVYPMLDYERVQIVENACKALVHASFFGPGSVVAFDAVSLNISGDTLYQAGDVAGAAKEFERGLKLDPREENLYNSLGVCYGVQGDQEKALAAFEKAIHINPDNVMALHNAGYSKSIMKDTDGALAFFLKAHKLGGDLFEVAFHTGKLLVETGRPEEGRQFLEQAVRLNPDSGPGHFFMGECYRKMGQPDPAIQAYGSAVRRNPHDAGALSALGLLYDEKNENPEISMLFCEKSVELAPENGLYLYRLGTVLQHQGEVHKALAMLEKARALGYDAAEGIAAIEKELAKGEGEDYAHL